MVKRSLAACGLALAVCLSAGMMQATAQDQPQQGPDQGQAQGPDQGQAQSPDQGQPPAQESSANVARLSFVQGGVQVSSGGQVQFQQAVANMPLLEGSRLQTGQDGQAEVEFGDGSVARLTPNSALQIDHLSGDSIEMQQSSGLGYYELNVGQGHPAYQVVFSAGAVSPTANAIFRLDLDNAPEIAATTGTVAISSNGQQVGGLNAGQSFTFEPNGNSPYTVSQTINQDSWDQWNQDRDQAISQEASAQTTVRDGSSNSGDENWNDLDYYGDWYSVPGNGNVWVPAGVSTGWDPYGLGYWGFYPGMGGYTWISGYPWGWLPYHCGMWSYYSFGWGWAPGGCGIGWRPFIRVRGYPGYFMPRVPAWRAGLGRPVLSARLVLSDRGAVARGPWGMGHALPVINHQATLNVGGRAISPIGRTPATASGFAARGTSPGVRAALGTSVHYQERGYAAGAAGRSTFAQGSRPLGQEAGRPAPQQQYNRPQQGQQQRSSPPANSRSTYVPRSTPTPHYSAPPAHSSGGGASHSSGGGGGHSGGGGRH